MSEAVDLRGILKSWPYDPDSDARLVRGEDGREILQVRTPIGIEQYEMEGRPDGLRPHGLESALEYQTRRLEKAKAAGRESDFELDPADCTELFTEGTLFYFRYIRLFQLKDWARTLRDTGRNLRVFDMVHRYARREEDQAFLEKWRPYILRLYFTAAVMLELDKGAYDAALRLASEAVEKITGLEEVEDETFTFERERSLAAMQELTAQIRKQRPLSDVERLEMQLRRAIERQEFEKAAQLRDRLRVIRQQRTC
jgi:hypothetical protein